MRMVGGFVPLRRTDNFIENLCKILLDLLSS